MFTVAFGVEEPSGAGVVDACVEAENVNVVEDVRNDTLTGECIPNSVFEDPADDGVRGRKSGDEGDVEDCLRKGKKEGLDNAVDEVLLCEAAVGMFMFMFEVDVSVLVLPLEVGLALLGTTKLLLPVEGGLGNPLSASSLEVEAVLLLALSLPEPTPSNLSNPGSLTFVSQPHPPHHRH
ncbi:hypothetical protein BDQ17DRAFT_1331255 [Cyathus striatus]|nr:hypothetical protein BDQ17DRAFT_1331255 [Cyathus striatus]